MDALWAQFEYLNAVKLEMTEREWTESGAETVALAMWDRHMNRVEFGKYGKDEDEGDDE